MAIMTAVYHGFSQPSHTNAIRPCPFPSKYFLIHALANHQMIQSLNTESTVKSHTQNKLKISWCDFPLVTCIICHGVSNSVRCARRKNPPRAPAAGFFPTACKHPTCPCPSTECPRRARFPKLSRSALCLAWRAHFFLWYCSQAKRDSWNYRLNG
jgi:hypothetical protein